MSVSSGVATAGSSGAIWLGSGSSSGGKGGDIASTLVLVIRLQVVILP